MTAPVIALLMAFWAPLGVAWAQPRPPGSPGMPSEFYNGTSRVGYCQKFAFSLADFLLAPSTGSTSCTLSLATNITKLGSCIGDATADLCGTVNLSASEVRHPHGTNPSMTQSGNLGFDTTDNQVVMYVNGAVRTLSTTQTYCAIRTGLTSADDDFEFWMAPASIANPSVTITGVACHCQGTCSTLATFTLEDGDGAAMTITGTNPACVSSGNATYAAVTAGNTLSSGEALAFDVTNTPSTTANYVLCVTYTVTRQ